MVSGVNCWDISGPGLLPDASQDGTSYQAPAYGMGAAYTVNNDNRLGAIAAVYQGNGFFSFADGHATAMSPLVTNSDPKNSPEKNQWNAYRQESLRWFWRVLVAGYGTSGDAQVSPSEEAIFKHPEKGDVSKIPPDGFKPKGPAFIGKPSTGSGGSVPPIAVGGSLAVANQTCT